MISGTDTTVGAVPVEAPETPAMVLEEGDCTEELIIVELGDEVDSMNEELIEKPLDTGAVLWTMELEGLVVAGGGGMI